jgi:hypothetical protein
MLDQERPLKLSWYSNVVTIRLQGWCTASTCINAVLDFHRDSGPLRDKTFVHTIWLQALSYDDDDDDGYKPFLTDTLWHKPAKAAIAISHVIRTKHTKLPWA